MAKTADKETASWSEKLVQRLFVWATKVNTKDIRKRVAAVRKANPAGSPEEWADALIKAKCERTAKIGVATSAASVVPVLGTAFTLTLGMVVDLSSTVTAQAELVLEIAEALGIELTQAQQRETILWVLGIGATGQKLGLRAGQKALARLGERASQRWLSKAIPFVGIAASGSLNYFSTYLIGKRAKAYFAQGPEATGSWSENLRAISGFDERKLANWLSQSQSQIREKLVTYKEQMQQRMRRSAQD